MGGKQDKEKIKYRDAGSSQKNVFKLKSRHYSRNNSPVREVNSKSPKVGENPSIILYNDSMEKFVTNQRTQEKGQLRRYLELFENEKDSDVTFLVGIEPNIWRLPAHKFILVAANPVFAAMLKGPLSSRDVKEEVPIEDLDPKAFENVLRYMYTNDLKLTSIDLALATVFAAEKYMILDLIQLCLQHLEVNLTINNVLEIYPRIRFLAFSRQNQFSTNVILQTAIVQIAPQEQSFSASNNNLYIPLLNRCLEFIDQFADQVLCLEDLEGLSEAELSEIVFRDSLQLKSELNVFRALQTWATQQCKFQQKEITVENKREVLESALYSVRYILMSRDEFMNGPYLSDLLSKDEKSWFLKSIDGHNKCEPPHHLADRQRYFQKKRCNETAFNNAKGGSVYEHDNLSTINNYPKKTSRKRCCRVTKVFTEVFLCFSLFFD